MLDKVKTTVTEYKMLDGKQSVIVALSGGADSMRNITLRNKPSTGQWFVFSDSYRGLLADIRIPKCQDAWA